MTGIAFNTFREVSRVPETCGICWSELPETGELAHKTGEVFHRYHNECIQQWLTQNKSCPKCKALVTSINGAPVNISDAEQHQAVMEAVEFGDLEAVRVLLTGRNMHEGIRRAAVCRAAGDGHIDIVRLLLEGHNISENARNCAIFNAAGSGHLETVRFLLVGHTLLEEESVELWVSSICRAARHGHVDVVRLLLNHHPVSAFSRIRAASAAVFNRHTHIARLLLTDRSIAIVSAGIFAALAGWIYYTQPPGQHS